MFRRVTLFFAALVAVFGLEAGSASAANVNEWRLSFSHNAGKSGVDFSKSSNAASLAELEGIAAATAGRTISKIEIRSYSSPEGALAWNRKLAGLRSDKVSQLIKEKFQGVDDSVVATDIVAEDWDSAVKYLENSDKAWKGEALQIIRNGGGEVKSKLEDLWAGEAWDDLLWNCFSQVRRTEVVLSFAPDSEISEPQNVSESRSLSIKFPVGRTSVALSYMKNQQVATDLKNLANTVAGKIIVLDSYSSPEGRASWNMVLARRRAESVKNYLVTLGFDANAITVRSVQENWAGLAETLRDGWFGAEREQVLGIINDATITDGQREQQLRSIGGSVVWNRIVASWMADLRRVDISFE